MNRFIFGKLVQLGLCCISWKAMAESLANDQPRWQILYQENFEQIEDGELPEDFFVLDGNFYVTSKEGRKCLAMAPYPVNENGFLFGPRISEEILEFSFSCLGGAKSRRNNVFEALLGGIRGFKLRLNPATHQALLSYQDIWQKSYSMHWSSREWMRVRFAAEWNLEETGTNLKIKIFKESDTKPTALEENFFVETKIPVGKCALFGFSYAEVEMYWDDLQIRVKK